MSLPKALIQNLELLIAINNDFKNDLDLEYKKLTPFRNKNIVSVKTRDGLESDMSVEHEEYIATQKSANKIIKKYNLSYFYYDGVVQYLQDKKLYNVERETKWKYMPFISNDPKNNKNKIVVMPLLQESNIADIQKYWKEIVNRKEILYKELNKKSNLHKLVVRKNFDRDLEIYKLQQSKFKAKEIKEKINIKFPNSPIQYQDVSKIIKRLRDLAKQVVESI